MKVSQLIDRLGYLQDQYGDLDVTNSNDRNVTDAGLSYFAFDKTEKIEIEVR